MRLSRFFLPILRETPKEAEIISHRLMLRAGMVRQEAAGIYAFLPLGLPAENRFWSGAAAPWTQVKLWRGENLPTDHALDG